MEGTARGGRLRKSVLQHDDRTEQRKQSNSISHSSWFKFQAQNLRRSFTIYIHTLQNVT